MTSWWWLIVVFIVGLFCGYNSGYYYAYSKATEFLSRAGINGNDIELSEARLEALWLSKRLKNICNTPDCHDCCKAERWREDANKWAKKIINERIKEKVK